MSARQAFTPRPPSCIPLSEPHPHPIDGRARDGDKDMFANGNGKPRSISAFLGQKRSVGNTASGPTQRAGLGRAHTSTNRRSFEGIRRPEMTPMSIIPYPATTQLEAGMERPGAGQTPRKTAGPGTFEFSRPMTPVSVPRSLKKGSGIFAENQGEEATPDNVSRSGVVFMRPEGESRARANTGAMVGGYMRVFEGPEGVGSAGGLRMALERDVVAPVPGYALGGLDANSGDILVRSSRSFGPMVEEGSPEKTDSQGNLVGTKRRMHYEDAEESERHNDKGYHTQESAKRMKQVQHDPNEYFPISSPHIPPTPGPPAASANVLDPTLVVGSLVENMEEFVSLEQVEKDWKRWRECTTEEWLKGADVLAQEYTDILNMVKDHLTEKVLVYASMISSVEEKRTEVNRNIETIHGKWNVVRENISKVGMKK